MTKQNVFANIWYVVVLNITVASYGVLVLFATMPAGHEAQNTVEVYAHVFMVSFLMDLLGEFEFTMVVGVLFARTDKRVSAVHVTILGALLNMTSFLHKTYIFFMVESFGVYMPQIAFTTLALAFVILRKNKFISLKDVERKEFYI